MIVKFKTKSVYIILVISVYIILVSIIIALKILHVFLLTIYRIALLKTSKNVYWIKQIWSQKKIFGLTK